MLAGTLLNLPLGGLPKGRPKPEYEEYLRVNRYISADAPEIEVAKEIVRAVYKINLPKETKVEVEEIVGASAADVQADESKVDIQLLISNYVAYNRLVDILVAYAREEEELALVMAMLGVE